MENQGIIDRTIKKYSNVVNLTERLRNIHKELAESNITITDNVILKRMRYL